MYLDNLSHVHALVSHQGGVKHTLHGVSQQGWAALPSNTLSLGVTARPGLQLLLALGRIVCPEPAAQTTKLSCMETCTQVNDSYTHSSLEGERYQQVGVPQVSLIGRVIPPALLGLLLLNGDAAHKQQEAHCEEGAED